MSDKDEIERDRLLQLKAREIQGTTSKNCLHTVLFQPFCHIRKGITKQTTTCDN